MVGAVPARRPGAPGARPGSPPAAGPPSMCLARGLRGKNKSLWTTTCPILILLILGFLFAALSFVASALLAPKKRPTAAKTAPYECGIVPGIEPPTRFPVRFYLIAMIFIIFDIEIVFLYPWAVIFRQLRLVRAGRGGGLRRRGLHLLPLPGEQRRPQLGSVQAAGRRPCRPRTSESTIARITAGPGGPGRCDAVGAVTDRWPARRHRLQTPRRPESRPRADGPGRAA